MNIVMVHPHDIMTSPWTIRLVKLAAELASLGHQVTVFYFIEYDRRLCGYMTSTQRELPERVSFQPLHKYKVFTNFWRIYRALRRADVLHIQKCFPHVLVPALGAALLCDVVTHYDWDDWEEGITMDYLGSGHPFTKLIGYLERHSLTFFDTLSVSSEGLREKALQRGFSKVRMTKIPVGADSAQFSPSVEPYGSLPFDGGSEKYKVVLYSGQIEGANYAPLFLEAAWAVLQSRADVRFVVVGGGFRLIRLKEKAVELGIEEYVHFTDYVMHSEVPRLIARADVCVATFDDNDITRCKSPLKIVEYMAMGKPIIASAVGEVKEMLADCGRLVAPGNVQLLGQEIIYLLEHPEEAESLGEKARTRVLVEYNWERGAARLLDMYTLTRL